MDISNLACNVMTLIERAIRTAQSLAIRCGTFNAWRLRSAPRLNVREAIPYTVDRIREGENPHLFVIDSVNFRGRHTRKLRNQDRNEHGASNLLNNAK